MHTPTITSHLFRFETSASPTQVWSVLTGGTGDRFYYGMEMDSDWTAGSEVTLRAPSGPGLQVQVLLAKRPCRLSFVLTHGPGHPDTYVTWDLRRSPPATIVQLTVDEFDGDADDIEAAWLPVVTTLQVVAGRPWVDGGPGPR